MQGTQTGHTGHMGQDKGPPGFGNGLGGALRPLWGVRECRGSHWCVPRGLFEVSGVSQGMPWGGFEVSPKLIQGCLRARGGISPGSLQSISRGVLGSLCLISRAHGVSPVCPRGLFGVSPGYLGGCCGVSSTVFPGPAWDLSGGCVGVPLALLQSSFGVSLESPPSISGGAAVVSPGHPRGACPGSLRAGGAGSAPGSAGTLRSIPPRVAPGRPGVPGPRRPPFPPLRSGRDRSSPE